MRRLLFLLLTLSFAAVQAYAAELGQQKTGEQSEKSSNCSYTVAGQVNEIPVGTRLCWRSPAPFSDYTLLQCGPPLNELTDGLKHGDPRCDRYEERQ
jgi:hypothetical protein